ncbi:MAG: Bax inhibitor-1/YccA family protein [Chitinophagaceae bacterium]
MAILKSGNPTFNEKTFEKSIVFTDTEVMTERGTLNKFFLLCLLVIASASFTWSAASQGKDITSWMWIGAIGGFVVALVTMFKPMWASFLAPIYALLEGVFVGGISVMYNHAFDKLAPGIIMQAVALTFGTVLAMFFLYRFKIIQATERLKSVVITATMGIGIFYLLSIVLRMFNINIGFIHEGSTLGIIFSLVVVGVAALNLILDFDNIETGVARGAPKYMEWYGAFGLIVTIVWLYLEILRLLGKLNSRN